MARNITFGVKLTGDSSGAVKAMKLTEAQLNELTQETRQLSRAANDADGQFRSWAKGMGDMRGILAGIGAAAGAAAAGLGILGAQSIAQTADMDRLADSLGVSVEGLQELSFAATQTGAEAGDMAEALVAVSDAATQAVQGGGDTAQMFQAIGLSVAELQSKNPAELFRITAGALATMEDSARRTAIASSLFGEDLASKLLPLLTGGRDVIRQFAEQAHRLGLIMSGELTAGAVDTEQAFGALAAIVDKQFTAAIVEQSEAWTGIAETLSGEAFQQGLSFSVNTFASLAGEIAETVAQLGKLVAAVNAFDLGDIGAIVGKRILDNSGIGFLYGLTHDRDLSEALFGGSGKVYQMDPVTVTPPVRIGIHGGTPVSTGGTGRPPLPPAGSLGTLLGDLPTITASADELEAELAAINEQQRELARTGDDVAFTLTSGFESAVLAGEDLRGVLQDILGDLQAIVLRQTVTEPAADFFSGLVQGGLSSILGGIGGATGGGRAHLMTTAMADGGIVDRPTIFPMANGVGLMGEAGPEAILPLTRIGGQLGVRATGGATIHQTNNITVSGGTASEIAQLKAEITRASAEAAKAGAEGGRALVMQDMVRGGPTSTVIRR